MSSNPPKSVPHPAHTNGHLSKPSLQAGDPSHPVSEGQGAFPQVGQAPPLDRSASSSSQDLPTKQSNGTLTGQKLGLSTNLYQDESALADTSTDTPTSRDGVDDRSASHDSRRASKRKITLEDDEYIANNPELYGLRRSVRIPSSWIDLTRFADFPCRHALGLPVAWYISPSLGQPPLVNVG